MALKVFIVDDHELIREGIRSAIAREPDLEVAGEAAGARDAIAMIPPAAPDVVVLDLKLPDGDGVEVCREIRSDHPDIAVLVLTSFQDDDALFDVLLAGASGFMVKGTPISDIVEGIRKVGAGQSLLDPTVTNRVLEMVRTPTPKGTSPIDALTEQERRVLELIADGKTNREIAKAMHLAEKTVKNYVTSVLSKLGVRHRTGAALFAVEQGIQPRHDEES